MPRYTLRQLEYFLACVEHRSIAQAAQALNVAQPTISAAIAKLEAQFGAQLLLRHHSQGVSPSPAANRILQAARALMSHANDLERSAKDAGTSVSGPVRLGSFVTLAPVYLPCLVRDLGLAYPEISPVISEGTQEVLVDGLLSGALDVALMYDLDLPDTIHRSPLAALPPYVALPRDHPLAAQTILSLADLVTMPMILLDVPPSRDYFLGLFRDKGLEPVIAHSSPSLELVRGMVGQGLGYALLVTRPVGDLAYDGREIAVRRLESTAEPSRIVLARLASLRPTRLVESLSGVATRMFARGGDTN